MCESLNDMYPQLWVLSYHKNIWHHENTTGVKLEILSVECHIMSLALSITMVVEIYSLINKKKDIRVKLITKISCQIGFMTCPNFLTHFWSIIALVLTFPSLNGFTVSFGRCSIRTRMMIMMNGWPNPNRSQMSMSFIYDVGGSVLDTDWLRVYMTNMEVIATGKLVLKCSGLKYTVIYSSTH